MPNIAQMPLVCHQQLESLAGIAVPSAIGQERPQNANYAPLQQQTVC